MPVKEPEQKDLFNKDLSDIEGSEFEKENGRVVVRGDLPPELDIPWDSELLLIGEDQSYATHGVHKYPAKFIPEFPRWALKKYSEPGDLVIDPFSGSGTTAVEAVMNNRIGLSVDIDPLALLLTNIKTTAIDPKKLKKSHQKLVERIVEGDKEPESIPEFKNRDHWFEPEITEKLSFIKEQIEKEKDENIQKLFQVSMSSIVRSVSNADPGSHKPCVRKGMNRNLPDPIDKFIDKLSKNVEGAIQFYEDTSGSPDAQIIEKDARNVELPDDEVDLAITSPPYINALDYARTHKLEYYWLGFFKDSLVDLKKKFVGTEKVYADQYRDLHEFGIPELDEIIASIYEEDNKRAFIVYKFFEDMKKNLKEVKRILKPGGKYVMFVGNNQIKDHLVENWKFLMTIARELGWSVQNRWRSGVINHYIKFDREEKIDTDHVIVFEK
ncbi:MAG: DNA methyltransferase [Flavobacteriales bacterium]